jgi:branched-chain amino acid transport system permease protein
VPCVVISGGASILPKGGGPIDLHLFLQFLIAGVIMGILYCLMALGINFIYGIMKVINWSMGQFFMIGSYVQYLLITHLLGATYWYIGVLASAFSVFWLGLFVQRILIKPMFVGIIEEKMEYATIVTIALAILFQNMAVAIGGPRMYTPPDYYGSSVHLGPLPVSGNRFVALIGALIMLALFYYTMRKTWIGKAFQGVAQNRPGIQTAGIDVLKFDMVAFGIGTALAAAGGALLAPIFLAHPMCGLVPTVRGFEIIVIAGLGSIPGVLVASLMIGIAESLGSFFINPSFLDIYGFGLLMIILLIKPFGLFGKEERAV